jgi:plasmid stabilization system protein ParE
MAEIRLTPAAETSVARNSAWWRENRSSAPDLVEEEFAAACALLAEAPHSGRPVSRRRIPGLRRVLLPATRHHLYYVFDEAAGEVVVLALWSAIRRRGPRLSEP